MAYIMHLAGFDVKDVPHDRPDCRKRIPRRYLASLFSWVDSPILMFWEVQKAGQAHSCTTKKARVTLENFFSRTDTLSLGVCNGCS